MCEHTQKTLTLYLQGKDNFIDVFQVWLPRADAKSRCSIKILKPDSERKVRLYKLWTFDKKKGILIKYIALYVNKENGLAKQKWHIIVTIMDLILIDNRLPNRFWAEAMETANYLQNKLPIRSKNHNETISKKAWIDRQQDFYHICIFGNLVFCNIQKEKRIKSNHWKVQERILIRYSLDRLKNLYIREPQTKQVVIASKSYIDKSEQITKLLTKWPLEKIPLMKKKGLAGELRPKKGLQDYLDSTIKSIEEQQAHNGWDTSKHGNNWHSNINHQM